MEQQLRHRWPDLREWIDPLSIVVILLIVGGALTFVVGYGRPSALLQALGALVVGAGLSALVGALTGRWAIRQQSAKEANLTRKRETYGPLYAELKALCTVLAKAKGGESPAPQRIDNNVEAASESMRYNLRSADEPTYKCWPQFRKDYRNTDFRATAQSLLDEVQGLATNYNTAVEAAREAAITLLASHIDNFISEGMQSTDHASWKRQQAERQAHPQPVGHQPPLPYDWFGHFDGDQGSRVAKQWLTYWPGGTALSGSLVLGWLLAGQRDKAASYVHRQYPAEGGSYPPPPLDRIQSIFEQAWPTMQQDAKVRAAVGAREKLYERVQTAEGMLANGLRHIQQRYEGGEPLV